MQTIGGASVYVTLPTGDYDRTKAVLFLTDVFELKLENNKVGQLSCPCPYSDSTASLPCE